MSAPQLAAEPDAAAPNSKLAKWETRTSIIMLLFSVAWLVLASYIVIAEPTGQERTMLRVVLYSLWLTFLADYLIRLVLAEHRGKYFRESLLDLVSVLIPIFRPFHLLSYLRKMPYFGQPTRASIRVRVIIWVAAAALLFIYTIALAVLEVERYAPGANITNFGDALWWAASTISTVGYGDVYPVTILGRFFAVALMVGGIAIVGTSSALVISTLNEAGQKLTKHFESHSHHNSEPK